jgi:K+-transporting ATPase ATPase A chain
VVVPLVRLWSVIPVLILAQRFALQPARTLTGGTLPTDTIRFGVIVIATSLIVVALTYLPVMALGPIVEHLLLIGG